MDAAILGIAAMFGGFLLDQRIGDPERLAHPVVAFGKSIAYIENLLNKGEYKFLKGLFTTLLLVLATFFVSHFLLLLCSTISTYLGFFVTLVIVFYCLAGYTLRKEVREVFEALNNSIDEGRKRLSRIVGRDTNQLSPQKIRVAALETLAENLSDGVIAPLFWYALLGAPGMLSYKMINTLDSMIGYKNERYRKYGKFAAKLDDVANYIPARLTALIMLLITSNI
jgi:adenosylcobinamide-phosphate synthase